MRYDKIDPQLFIDNREKLVKKLQANSIAIFNSNDEYPRNGDQTFVFRQNSDTFWVSGLDQEKTIVILFPDSPVKKYREMAFVIKTNDKIARWEGHKFTKKEATNISAIKNIFWLDEFEMILNEIMTYANNVYLNSIELPKFKTEVPYKDKRFAKWIKEEYPNHNYHRLAPYVYDLRTKKHSIEIELMGKACEITNKAFRRVLKFVKPDLWEYEIQAEIEHEFLINKATGNAYQPIIAAGKNALCLHYTDNNDKCKNGDLILFDFGAEYANYSADMSRTIPVNGRFSPRQKECYNAVLNVSKQSKNLMKVGASIDEVNSKVNKLMEKEMIKLGLFSEEDISKQYPQKPLYQKYFMHGTSHFMGLDVHDVGQKHLKFEEGMVLSFEPGIYITEENIAIRIENDILITNKGAVNLMENIPVEVDEIEKLMASK
ncbi:MAG: aminopeptidase P family protein [Bacteroidota bacterium]|nr:aminopeptidase P family protein [Bacteroidota bacterium]